MLKYFRILMALAIVFVTAAFIKKPPVQSDAIFYASLNRGIHIGQLDGVITAKELQTHGDFGVGSQEKLGGELVLLDGKAYKIPEDGKAVLMPEKASLAFAAVKYFKADKIIKIKRLLYFTQLQDYLDSIMTKNAFAAIKITGKFTTIDFHCYPEQEKPYKPADNVPLITFMRSNTEGTMVGFFTPKSALVLNSPAYHFHFIDQLKTTGGHVDQCLLEQATIEIDYADALSVMLPPAATTENTDLNKPVPENK